MPRALLSVSDKSGLVAFARGLAERGFELVSTGGTAQALESAGLAVVGIADVTGFPEMMDGRVKTLHPKVHGGILARRGHAADLDATDAHGITLIDLVVVNLYPFETTIAKEGVTLAEAIEQIDIGGPSMLRASAKNHRHVVVLCDPSMYSEFLEELAKDEISDDFRFRCAVRVFENASPAIVAAFAIAVRASRSEPSA